MKKTLQGSVLLSATTLLSACGGSQPPESTQQPPVPQAPDTPAPAVPPAPDAPAPLPADPVLPPPPSEGPTAPEPGPAPAPGRFTYHEETWENRKKMAAFHLASVPGITEQDVHTWPTDSVFGDAIILEIEVPAGADLQEVRIAAPKIGHHAAGWMARFKEKTSKSDINGIGAAARCYTQFEPADMDQERSAMVRLNIMGDDYYRHYCTGTLLNNKKSDGRPYILTARHCVASEREAGYLMAYWFFRSDVVKNLEVPEEIKNEGGAVIVYESKETDTVLLKLRNPPLKGAVYAGSYFGDPVKIHERISGWHQPQADFQKYSAGVLQKYSECKSTGDDSGNYTCTPFARKDASHLSVRWSSGITESGSSGGSGNTPGGGSGGSTPPGGTPTPPPAPPPSSPPVAQPHIDYIPAYKPSSKSTQKTTAQYARKQQSSWPL